MISLLPEVWHQKYQNQRFLRLAEQQINEHVSLVSLTNRNLGF